MVRSVRRTVGIILALALIISMLPSAVSSAAVKPSLSKASQNILIGKSYDFNIKNKSNGSSYKWSSSNQSIATVNKVGLVKGIKKGVVKISCTIKDSGKTSTLNASVTIIQPANKLTINNKITTIKTGSTYDLNKTLSPKSSNDKTKWTSSDDSIIKPDKSGKFKALKEGKVTITATTLGGAKDSITILVKPGKELMITSKNVKNGCISVTGGTYHNIIIANSVGAATITLTNLKVTGDLQLESSTQYKVYINESIINNVKIINPEIISFASGDEDIPNLIAGTGTTIINVDVKGNISIERTSTADIKNITISADEHGNITISLIDFRGDIVVNAAYKSDVTINTTNCNIGKATVKGNMEGNSLSFVDLFSGTNAVSEINSLSVEAYTVLNVGIKTNNLIISAKVTNLSLTVTHPIRTLTNYGEGTTMKMESVGKVEVIKGDKPIAITAPVPTVIPTPTTLIPGINENNGVFTFDEHVASFTLKVGSKSYELSANILFAIALDWDNSQTTYTVPNTIISNANSELILKRAGASYIYDVTVTGEGTFRLVLNPDNLTVTVSGGSNVSITNVTRDY